MNTTSPVSQTETNKTKWRWLGLALIVGVIVAVLPTPEGLSPTSQFVLAIMAFTVMLWIFRVMNNGIASVLMMALMVLFGVSPAVVLSGFSAPQFWILLAVLYYGFAMQSTGLAKRVSLHVLNFFPTTYAGILSSFFVIGLVLALGIPSMTVRTAIVVPIAWALTQSIGLAPKSRSGALVMLSSVEMAVVPGCAFLYGSLYGPVVDSLFRTKGFELSWLGYAQVMTLPTLLFCVLLLAANWFVLRPETPLSVSPGFARKELAVLGPLKRAEVITALVVLASIAYWATDRIHHLPAFLVGMLALAVFSMTGVLRENDIGTGVSWSLLLFFGGIFSLANVIQQQKIAEWFGSILIPVTERLTFSTVIFLIAMALGIFLLKFLDPSGFIALAVLFLPMSDVSVAAGIPPLVLMAALILPSMPFWVSYQNIWIAMSEGMTVYQGFSSSQRIRLAHIYAIVSIIALVLAVGFWRLLGIL